MTIPTTSQLLENFHRKYGPSEKLGPGPRLRRRFGYFNPDDVYETTLECLVNSQTRWLDVGGGRDIFKSNARTAQLLASRCRLLVGLDPSPNILDNRFVHERVQGVIEDYRTDATFDLITMNMVAEHLEQPAAAISAISRLTASGGRLVIYTVDKWSPVTIISALVPNSLHHPLKKLIWNVEEQDTFPTTYLMNTRGRLRSLMSDGGFQEEAFKYLDDCRTFARWRALNAIELTLWRLLRSLGLRYPEVCLLGVYRKT
jgi:SAM-dependent methyltransferase